MPAKTLLFEAQRANDAIVKASKVKDLASDRFDVQIYAPDDRRADEAIKKDKSLRDDLASACERACRKFVDEMAKFLADKSKEREKLQGDARRKFDLTFSGPLHTAATSAASKLEANAAAETKKRWKAAVDGDPKLKGVRFEPIVVPFLVDIDFVSEKGAAKEPDPEQRGEKDAGLALTEAQIDLKIALDGLAEASGLLAKVPAAVKSVRGTLDRVQADIDAGPRESQRDDPATEGDEEPDESALDDAIFAEHAKALDAAYMAVVDSGIAFKKTAEECGYAAKQATKAMKRLSPLAASAERAKSGILAKHVDELGAAARELVAIESEAKVARRVCDDAFPVLSELSKKKRTALGLLPKARIDVTPPVARLDAVIKSLRAVRLAPIPGA
jgi:hypothetical protein